MNDTQEMTQDIVETAIAAGSFKTLAQALTVAGLVPTLKGQGPFTVFAPSDEAFAKLPAGTVEDLVKEENLDTLRNILSYHVVAGRLPAAEVLKLESAMTISGKEIAISMQDGRAMANQAQIIKTDIESSNGIIHVIDNVLLP